MEETIQAIKSLLATYQPSDETKELVRDTHIVLVVGIVGAGKNTVKHELFKSAQYYDMVSHTTRPPRENAGVLEQDGVEYHFVSLSQMKEMLEAGEFVEAKFIHGTTVYGTSVIEVRKAHQKGMTILNDIDVQGVAEYKAISDNVTAMFLIPPSYDVWYERLAKRYGREINYEDLENRMRTAVNELEHALEVDYYHFIINDGLDRAVYVINEIAQGNDTFTDKDAWAREQAAALLIDIKRRLEIKKK